MTPLLLTKTESAEYLGVTRETIRNLIANNQLRVVQLPGKERVKIPRAELEQYVSRSGGYLNREPRKRKPLQGYGAGRSIDEITKHHLRERKLK